MYKYIKTLFHINPLISHVAYLYQDITTNEYYLSYTNFNSENIIDKSNEYLLLNNEPKITKQTYLKNIDIITKVNEHDFLSKQINNYKL